MSGVELKLAENGFYYVHWSEGRRSKRQSTRQKTLPAAKAYLAEWLIEDAKPKAALTCEEIWLFYTREHVDKECAAPSRHAFAWQVLRDRFGPLTPAEVTREVVRLHVAARLPTKPSTVSVELRLLLASWNFAVKHRLVASTDLPPADILGIPKAPPPRERWLTESEVARLFRVAAEARSGPRLSRVERFMWLALETAARRTAILELTWSQVDFETGVIHLNPPGRQQTKKRRASVPISTTLRPILQRAHAERTGDLVLDHDRRLPDALNAVAERAGIAGVTPHVFRHTAATWMARRGVALWKIAKILGNTTEQVEKVYAKHSPDDLRADIENVGGVGLLGADVGACAEEVSDLIA